MKKELNIRKKGFSLAALSNTRGYLMGIATIMVVAFHSPIGFDKLFPNSPEFADFLTVLRKTCVSGVDIFLLLSGIGLFFSLSSNKSLRVYYKKRATRILPAVLLVSVYWFAQRGSEGIADYLKDVFLVSFYTDGTRYFWYFALIIFLYAIYPLIHKLIDKSGGIGVISIIALTVLITLLYKKFDYQQFLYIEIALTRIPVFVVGVWLGKLIKNGVTISYLWLLLAGILVVPAIVIGYHYCPMWIENKVANYGNLIWIQRIMGNILGICLPILCAAALDKVKFGFFGTFLIWIGTYSMEVYLVHEKLGILLYNEITTGDPSHIVYYSMTFILTIPIAIALKAFSDNLNKNLFYRNKDNKKPA